MSRLSVSPLRFRIPIGVAVGVGVALLMACHDDHDDDNQFRSDVLDCESAAAHLESCCGPRLFDPSQIACHHLYEDDQGCGNSTVIHDDPDLTEDESDCILNLGCAAIQAHDVCGRVARRGLSISAGHAVPLDGGGDSISAPVCP